MAENGKDSFIKEVCDSITKDYFLIKKNSFWGSFIAVIVLLLGGWVFLYWKVDSFADDVIKGLLITKITDSARAFKNNAADYANEANDEYLSAKKYDSLANNEFTKILNLKKQKIIPRFKAVCNQDSHTTYTFKTIGYDSIMLMVYGSAVGSLTLSKVSVLLDEVSIGTMKFYNNMLPEGHMPFTPLIVTMKNRYSGPHEYTLKFVTQEEKITEGKKSAYAARKEAVPYLHFDENDFFSVLLCEY